MKLIHDWRESWKWFSIQLAALTTALPLAWVMIPADVKAYMPDGWEPWAFVVLGAATLIGRLIPQGET